MCWEAQSVGFGTSNVFGSANHNQIATPFTNGWSVLGFNGVSESGRARVHRPARRKHRDHQSHWRCGLGPNVTYFGLPVVGFAAETFQNDAITVNGKTFLSTFGVTLPAPLRKGDRRWAAPRAITVSHDAVVASKKGGTQVPPFCRVES